MNWNLFWLFVFLNVINVIIQTVKSIATIKCGKWAAALVNAVAYGLYTIVVVYTVCELNLWLKVIVVALANLIGVYVVKLIEEKSRKDKLWKVEATIHSDGIEPKYHDCVCALQEMGVSFNYIDAEKYIILNCYCETQEDSIIVKNILDEYDAKYFVSESKTL